MNYVDSFKWLAAHTFMHKHCSVNHKPWVHSKCLFKIRYNSEFGVMNLFSNTDSSKQHIVSLTSHSPCFFFHCSQAWAVRTHTQQERLKYSKHLCHKTPDKHTHTSIKPLWGSIVLGFCHQATEASENSCLQTTLAHTQCTNTYTHTELMLSVLIVSETN